MLIRENYEIRLLPFLGTENKPKDATFFAWALEVPFKSQSTDYFPLIFCIMQKLVMYWNLVDQFKKHRFLNVILLYDYNRKCTWLQYLKWTNFFLRAS